MRSRINIIEAAVAASSLAIVAAGALAQAGPSWNRTIEAVAIVPGSPGSASSTVTAVISAEASGLVGPVDLSTRLDVLVEGTVVSSEIFSLTASPAGGPTGGPCGMPCPLGETCYCHGLPPDCECGAWIAAPSVEVTLAVGDEVTVILYPAAGAAPESSTGDDSQTHVATGEPRDWNRRVVSITKVPVPTLAPDSFFDIFVDISLDAHYDGPTDLSMLVELVVGGDPYPAPIELPLAIAWDPCTGAPCAGPCALDLAGGEGTGTCVSRLGECGCEFPGPVIVFPSVQVPVGDEITVILYPAPGGLPELPGFGDDDEATLCEGDVDGNGVVGFSDLTQLLISWGPCPAPCPADLSGDGEVGFADLTLLLLAWGPCFPV